MQQKPLLRIRNRYNLSFEKKLWGWVKFFCINSRCLGNKTIKRGFFLHWHFSSLWLDTNENIKHKISKILNIFNNAMSSLLFYMKIKLQAKLKKSMSKAFHDDFKNFCNLDMADWCPLKQKLTYEPADNSSFYYWNQKFAWIQKNSSLMKNT